MKGTARIAVAVVSVLLFPLVSSELGAGVAGFIEPFSKGSELFVEGRYEEALPHARKAIAEFDANAMGHGLLGHILLNLGQYEEAEQALRHALSLPRGEQVPGVHFALALLITKGLEQSPGAGPEDARKKTEEALQLLDEARAVERESEAQLQLRGSVLVRLGRSAEAIETYESLFRTMAMNYRQKATGPLFRLYRESGTVAQAVQRLNKLSSDAGVDPSEALHGAFSTLYIDGARDVARDVINAQLEALDPASPARAMTDPALLCDEAALDRYFEADPPHDEAELVGGLSLVLDCVPGEAAAATAGLSMPRRKKRVDPTYPELARMAHIEATLVLRATIGKKGQPFDIRVIPNPTLEMPLGFEEAAIAAVRQWRYEPARRDGKPVDLRITIVLDFRLR